MSAKNPQNGPTFTKGKPIRRAPPAPNPGRNAAQQVVNELDAAKSRIAHKEINRVGLAQWVLDRLKRQPTDK
jgi:hypothetical protein